MPPKQQQQMESFTHEEFINAMRMEGRTVRVTPESLEAARAQEARRLPTTNSNNNVGRNWEALQEEEAERREREAREERKRKLQNVKTLEKRQEEEVTAETPPLPPPATNKKTTSATVESTPLPSPPPPLPLHEETSSSSPSTSAVSENHNKEGIIPAASAAAAAPPAAESPSQSIPTEQEEGNGKEVEECTKKDDRTLPITEPPPPPSSSSPPPTAVVIEPKVQTFEEARRSITRRALAQPPPPLPSAPPTDVTAAEAVAASDASSTTTTDTAAAPPPVPGENPSVTRVDGRHVRTLAVELWWVGSVDLDLSCLMFNKQMERCGIFFFGEQSGVAGDALFHTGDMLNAHAPNGAKETMIVHLDRLPPDVWYLYFVMTAFSADNCELVEEMLVRVADRTTAADSSGASSDRTLIGLDAKTMRTKRAAALALVARMDPPSRGGPSTFAVHCLESVCFSYGDTVRALSRDLHQHLTSTITAAK